MTHMMTHIKLFSCSLALMVPSFAIAQGGADADFEVLDRLMTQQWVHTDAEGTLRGQVDVPLVGGLRPAGLARVALVPLSGAEGSLTLHGRTTIEGSFTIENVPYGTYGLVVHSDDALAVYSLHVLPAARLPNAGDAGTNPIRKAATQPAAVLSDELRVYAAPTSTDFVIQRVRSYLPMELPASYEVKRFSVDPLPNRSVDGERRVAGTVEDVLKGRLVLPSAIDGQLLTAKNMNVMIVQGNEVIATTTTDVDGRFTIEQLPPGSYGLVAAGESGFGTVGFEFMGERTAAQSSSNKTRLVAFQPPADGPQEVVLEIVPSFLIAQLEAELLRDDETRLEEIGPPVPLNEFGWPVDPNAAPGGGFASGQGFGTGGGGGGGGSGGGLGGLGGLAALGLGAAALAGSGSSGVASPALP